MTGYCPAHAPILAAGLLRKLSAPGSGYCRQHADESGDP
jgi:hypothetical protein